MAQRERTDPKAADLSAITRPGRNETAEGEHDRVRTSNDADQARQREGQPTPHDTYDEVVNGTGAEPRTVDAAEVDWDGDGTSEENRKAK